MATKTKAHLLKEKKEKNRTFGENTSLGRMQDRMIELESRVEDLESDK